MSKEKIIHPSHYNKGIEMWDYAHSHGLDFFEGNIVKYITRWKQKGGIEDLNKASLLISFSSTTIEEALQARIPVAFFGGSNSFFILFFVLLVTFLFRL